MEEAAEASGDDDNDTTAVSPMALLQGGQDILRATRVSTAFRYYTCPPPRRVY